MTIGGLLLMMPLQTAVAEAMPDVVLASDALLPTAEQTSSTERSELM